MSDTAAVIAKRRDAPEKEADQAKHEVATAACADAPDLPAIIHTGGGGGFHHLSASESRKEAGLVSHEELERRFHEFITDPLTSLDNCPADKPPVGATIAFNATFGDLAKEGSVQLKLHPLYKRWTVFARGKTKQGHIGWYPAIVICHTPEYGVLPVDLDCNLPPELKGMFTGRMGEYKEPTTLDFMHMRDFADRYRWKKRQAKEQAKKLHQEQLKQYADKRKARKEETRDFIEYNKKLLERDVNRKYGSMQGFATVPCTSLEQFDKEHPRYLDIPVTGKDGNVLFYRRHRFKDIKRMTEEALEEAAAFAKALEDAGLDRVKVRAAKAKYLGTPELISRFELLEETKPELEGYIPTTHPPPAPHKQKMLVEEGK